MKSADEAWPGERVQRLLAPNASVMTGAGTNTYLVGGAAVAVIDPGCADPAHLASIERAAPGPIRWILVTHTHPDHSPGAMELAQRTGATVFGRPAPATGRQDHDFRPDAVLADGDEIVGPDFTLLVLHTPGHASNHLCYLLEPDQLLFTGDHIMQGSTVMISPPDGDMADYLASLRRLRGLPLRCLAPGHGTPMFDPPARIDALITHRLRRERKVQRHLARLGVATLAQLVVPVYDDVPAALHGLAQHSLLAHLEKLRREGLVVREGESWRV
ncbi:MAG: MBL fold metallo-hydrolase [Gammaproteobacteria bacterium]|nr:MBL fold metallo-hydrolase [Gammaproteobacteria bacterium]